MSERSAASMRWKSSNPMRFEKAKSKGLCFAIAFLFLLLPFTGCSGNRTVECISAVSLFNKEKLTLPIQGKNAATGGLEGNGYLTFETELTLDELYDILSKMPEIHASRYEHAIWIKKTTADGYVDYYCLAKHENHYVFSGMRGILITDIDKNGSKASSALLLPVHLITDSLILEGAEPYYTLYINAEYETSGNFDEYAQFYSECGWYEVELQGDEIILSGYKQKDDLVIQPAFDSAGANGTLEIASPYRIRFSEENGKCRFSISLK